jgi:hypothetical protein
VGRKPQLSLAVWRLTSLSARSRLRSLDYRRAGRLAGPVESANVKGACVQAGQLPGDQEADAIHRMDVVSISDLTLCNFTLSPAALSHFATTPIFCASHSDVDEEWTFSCNSISFSVPFLYMYVRGPSAVPCTD